MKFDNYMGKFASSGDVQTAVDNGDLVKPYVALVEDGNYIDWNTKKPNPKYRYLTFELLEDCSVRFNSQEGDMEVKINDGEWGTDFSIGVSKPYNKGTKFEFRKNGTGCKNFFNIFGKFKTYGNIMSLISKENFLNITTVGDKAFERFFAGSTGLTDASELILPATTLSNNCYSNMFQDCTSLTTAPELPATTLGQNCYKGMFTRCTSLITAPELPATTLVNACYQQMFQNCSNLNYIKCLATSLTGTYGWVNGVASTGTFIKAAGVSWSTGISGIPDGWTVQEV